MNNITRFFQIYYCNSYSLVVVYLFLINSFFLTDVYMNNITFESLTINIFVSAGWTLFISLICFILYDFKKECALVERFSEDGKAKRFLIVDGMKYEVFEKDREHVMSVLAHYEIMGYKIINDRGNKT